MTNIYATEGQIKFFRDLTVELVSAQPNMAEHTKQEHRDMYRSCYRMTRTEISPLIDNLKAALKVARSLTPRPRVEVVEGFYIETATNTPIKVQVAVHGSGQKYGKMLTDGSWNVVKGLVHRIAAHPEQFPKLTVETAGKFGKLYGMCIICGRTLTDETSIARGIGPVCSSKL